MKNNKTSKIIVGTVLTVVFLLTLLLTNAIVSRPKTLLHHHIPSNANVYLKINNPNLLRRFFFDFLFEADLQQKDYKQIDYRSRVQKIPISGIDITKDVYLFYENWGEENIIGIIFHLNDIDAYSDFLGEKENLISSFNEEIAIILIVPENLSIQNRDNLELYAKDLLQKNPDRTAARIAFSEGNKKNLFQLYVKGDERSLIRNINLELFMDDNFIEISGVGERNPLSMNSAATSYTYFNNRNTDRDYLEINAGKLPDTLNKYLNKVLHEIGVDIPTITSQQLFIYAFEIDNIRGSMALLPKFDGIFRFNEPLPEIIEMDSLKSKLLSLEDSHLKIGKMQYKVRQLNDYELFIGVNDVDFIEDETAPGLLIQGNPGVMLNIEGDGLVAQMAKLMPQVQHSKKLFNDMDSFRIESKEYRSDSIKVNGKILFPKEKTASIEIIKFLLKF